MTANALSGGLRTLLCNHPMRFAQHLMRCRAPV